MQAENHELICYKCLLLDRKPSCGRLQVDTRNSAIAERPRNVSCHWTVR